MPEKSAAAVQPAPSRPPIKTGKMENLTERINRIHDAIARRAFELFEETGALTAMTSTTGWKPNRNFCRTVPISMEETEGEVVVHAEVPALRPAISK